MNEELLQSVTERFLEALDSTDVEAEVINDEVDNLSTIGKLDLEYRKIKNEEEEAERKHTLDLEKIEIEKQKADNDAEKNRIAEENIKLEREKMEAEKIKMEMEAKQQKAERWNQIALKGMDIGSKVGLAMLFLTICAAGEHIKDAGIPVKSLPFYDSSMKFISKWI